MSFCRALTNPLRSDWLSYQKVTYGTFTWLQPARIYLEDEIIERTKRGSTNVTNKIMYSRKCFHMIAVCRLKVMYIDVFFPYINCYNFIYMPFLWRKPAKRPQNKISTNTKTNVPHFWEWNMVCNKASVPSTCILHDIFPIKQS